MSGEAVYLDASALAKFFLDEAEQAELAAYVAQRPVRATSRVSIVEVSEGETLEAYRGLHQRSPVLAAGIFLAFLSLAGVPPRGPSVRTVRRAAR